jgi:hypothetical protein
MPRRLTVRIAWWRLVLFLDSSEKSGKQRARIRKMSHCLEAPFQLNWTRCACSSNPSETNFP